MISYDSKCSGILLEDTELHRTDLITKIFLPKLKVKKKGEPSDIKDLF